MSTAKTIRLGVNIDHVATLRQARGTPYPSVLQAADLAERGGADSITVHLREDRRHIQDGDVRELKNGIGTALNLEMAVTEEMLAFAAALQPRDCCLVPERREELTTEGGLAVSADAARIRDACERLGEAGIQVALFIDPDPQQLAAVQQTGAPAVEIHTGAYADARDDAQRQRELERIRGFAAEAAAAGIEIHAGHGLTLDNVPAVAAIPQIEELNIGHSIVSRAVMIGLQQAVAEMRACIDAVTRN